MAELPIAFNLEGDYGYKVMVVDEEATIAKVIEMAVEQIAGVLVAPFPDNAVMRLRLHASEEPLADSMTVKDAGFSAMEAVVIYQEA